MHAWQAHRPSKTLTLSHPYHPQLSDVILILPHCVPNTPNGWLFI